MYFRVKIFPSTIIDLRKRDFQLKFWGNRKKDGVRRERKEEKYFSELYVDESKNGNIFHTNFLRANIPVSHQLC